MRLPTSPAALACLLLSALLHPPAARADAPADPDRDPLPALIKRATPGVVTVVAYDPDAAMPAVGTGFLVAPDEIVTARHVLARADRAVVRTSTGKAIPIAGVLADERASDLVLARLRRPVDGGAPLAIAADAPDVGERLFTISSPLGLEFTAADGIVSAYRDVPGAGVAMQHTVPVSAGSSGCPLVNRRGEVVAVQTGVITTGQKLVHAGEGLNFAVSAKLIPALKPGPAGGKRDPVALDVANKDLPRDWKPPITAGIDAISLHPLTRDDFRAAVPFFEAAVTDDPSDPDAHFRLGLAYEKAGDRDKAAGQYRKAVDLKPDFATALNNLGAVYIAQGEYDQAAKTLRRAVEAKQDYAGAYGNLAVAYVQQKSWPEALAAAKEAVRLRPDDAEARLNLGTAAVHTGDREEARRQYERLLKLDKPRAERLKAVLEREGGKGE